jgi:uncharacterized YccA/Bax inhibitor family protein
VATNPVLNKFKVPGTASNAGTATANPPMAPSAGDVERIYNQPAYGGPTYPPTGFGRGGGGGGGGGAPARYMTLDDVVVRTTAMLAVLLIAGAVSWGLTSNTAVAGGLLFVSLMGGLGLGLYMAFTMRVNAVNALIYSACQGFLLGAISRIFEERWPGIVIQAVTGTVMVAAGMLFVYKIGAIRVTPKFTRVLVGATIGVFGLMLVNLIAYLFTPGGLGLRDGGAIAIIFSLICIVVAAFNLVLDFDIIEQGIKHGADEKFAWYASFGLMVTLIWLYLEMLRLLGYLRSN